MRRAASAEWGRPGKTAMVSEPGKRRNGSSSRRLLPASSMTKTSVPRRSGFGCSGGDARSRGAVVPAAGTGEPAGAGFSGGGGLVAGRLDGCSGPGGAGFSGGFAGAAATGVGFSSGGGTPAGAGLSAVFPGAAFSGTGRSSAGRTAPLDAGRFRVEWTTITAIEIKADTAIKTAASITARTASAAFGFFRLLTLTPLRGFFPAAFGAFPAIFVFAGSTGFAGGFSVFFMYIKTRLSARRSLLYLSAGRCPDFTKMNGVKAAAEGGHARVFPSFPPE